MGLMPGDCHPPPTPDEAQPECPHAWVGGGGEHVARLKVCLAQNSKENRASCLVSICLLAISHSRAPFSLLKTSIVPFIFIVGVGPLFSLLNIVPFCLHSRSRASFVCPKNNSFFLHSRSRASFFCSKYSCFMVGVGPLFSILNIVPFCLHSGSSTSFFSPK